MQWSKAPIVGWLFVSSSLLLALIFLVEDHWFCASLVIVGALVNAVSNRVRRRLPVPDLKTDAAIPYHIEDFGWVAVALLGTLAIVSGIALRDLFDMGVHFLVYGNVWTVRSLTFVIEVCCCFFLLHCMQMQLKAKRNFKTWKTIKDRCDEIFANGLADERAGELSVLRDQAQALIVDMQRGVNGVK